jgi:DNA modification methylase
MEFLREHGLETTEAEGTSSAIVASAYPADTTTAVRHLFDRFRATGQPIPVSFRELVPWMKIGERATHYLHPYPAKLLPHIAHFFLASNSICPADGLVLDPFSGSGTVALEACLSGRRATIADTNPLAILITAAKHNVISARSLRRGFERVEGRYMRARTREHPAVVNIERWFQPGVIRALARLKSAIDEERSTPFKLYLLATFSAVVRRVSNADPRLSVPVVLKEGPESMTSADVWLKFRDQFWANARRIAELDRISPGALRLSLAGRDARRLHVDSGGRLQGDSVDLVITSPPYAGAQKYIRASSLSLGWLGIAEAGQLKPLENQTIGREHLTKRESMHFATSVEAANSVISKIRKRNSLRASICVTYLREMEEVICELHKVVRPGGKLVLVIGNNEVCRQKFMSSEYLCEIIQRLGFSLQLALIDEIKSRGLMTKRNRTASVITREWVLVFEKC